MEEIANDQRQWIERAKVAFIVLAGLLIYYPAFYGAWLWDDALYLTGNPLLHDPARLWKAWFAPGTFIEYYPIEQTVQWIQWQLWGDQTLGYHLTNLVLDIAGALLVWRLLAKFGLRLAWVGGLLFVLHPMNVSSVANISELKNTLSLPPFLLAMCAYVDFEKNGRPRDYLLALGFFLVAMLCKITMAPFPLVILLYAWWKRGRVDRRDLQRAAPFLVISLILSAMTWLAGIQYANLHPFHPAPMPDIGLLSRMALMGMTLSFYCGLFFWPVEPLQFYPRWAVDPPSFLQFLPWLAAAAVFILLWSKRRTWGRHVLLGLGFFLINLLPFSGIITISYMNYSWVMDHFLYLPMIGLIGLVVATLESVSAQIPVMGRRIGIVALSLAGLFLAVQSQDYAAAWTDAESLWTYTIERNPQAWLAHYNLGNDLRRQKKFDMAVDEYQAALAINPRFDWADNNLGMALEEMPNHRADAIAAFEEALQIRPHFPEARNNLANVLSQTREGLPDAIPEYEAVLKDQPDFVEAHYNLGLALAQTPGRRSEAIVQFQETLRLKPGFEPAKAALEKLHAPSLP